jgi:hypothetical protein
MNQCKHSRTTAGAKLVLSAILALTALIALTLGQPVHHGPFANTSLQTSATTSADTHGGSAQLSNATKNATHAAWADEGSSPIERSTESKPSAAVHHTPTQHLAFLLSDDCATCANELVTSIMACVIALLLVMSAFAGPRFFRILTNTPRSRPVLMPHGAYAHHRTVDLIALGISRT